MKNNIRASLVLIIVLLQFHSCKPDDEYYSLSQEAKDFVQFEVDDTFKLKNENTDEIITLIVTFKEFGFSKDGPNASPLISFGPTKDIFYEYGVYRFSDANNCFLGQVLITATETGGFELQVSISDSCSDTISNTYTVTEPPLISVIVNGFSYSNTVLLESNFSNLFYSKERGILKIEDLFVQGQLFTIVE